MSKAKTEQEECPKCGEPVPLGDGIVMCSQCGCEGGTSCCNPGGSGCPCAECEEKDGDDD